MSLFIWRPVYMYCKYNIGNPTTLILHDNISLLILNALLYCILYVKQLLNHSWHLFVK